MIMLGIVLLYFIGKAFYTLAQDHEKSKWLFAILGVISYYLGSIIGVLIIAFIAPSFYFGLSDMLINLLALPLGLASCVIFYYALKNMWKNHKKINQNESDLLDNELLD